MATQSLPRFASQGAHAALAWLSALSGIGEPSLRRRRAALATAFLRMAWSCLREGLAIKNGALALKVFGGLTLMFGIALHELLGELPWSHGGSLFTILLGLAYLILMGYATSTGWSNFGELIRKRLSDHGSASWRMREPARASSNERWHVSGAVAESRHEAPVPRRRL